MPKTEQNTLTGAAHVLLVVVSCILGFLLTEGTYRWYLYHAQPLRFAGDRNLWYFQDSPFQYSQEFGFEYIPGRYAGGAVYEGRVTRCWDPMIPWVINERGNMGRIKGSYKDADLKILVFGDSVTAWAREAPDGALMSWPDYLQDVLEERLKKSVHVVNFARDGYGILQMFDLAAVKVPEWRPDIAIIGFITDDLTRDRFWRMTTVLDGVQRIMTSSTPVPNPTWDTAADTFLVNSRATSHWCHKTREAGATDDPIVQELETVLREGRRRESWLADPLSLRQSFVVDRILRGDAYYTTSTQAVTKVSQMPRHALKSFLDDERTVANLKTLTGAGVPLVVLHFALYSELKQRTEFDVPAESRPRTMALIDSLSRVTGVPVYSTLEHVQFPIDNLESLSVQFLVDDHPSLRGHEFFAEMVGQVLLRYGYVRKGRNT